MADVVEFPNFPNFPNRRDNRDDSPQDEDTDFIDEGLDDDDQEKAPQSKGRLLFGALIPIAVGAVLVLLVLLQTQART